MGKNKRGKYGTKVRPGYQSQPFRRSKNKKLSARVKVLFLFSITAIGAAIWFFTSQSAQTPSGTTPYPNNVAGVFYTNPTITSDGAGATLDSSFVNTSKLVFVDLKLERQTSELTYQGRTIPLASYKNGNYLPLVVISTPQQKVIAGIRVCEPCGSFSFHIVEGKYLQCDSCGTRWDIETLTGVSGGCPGYPPPQLPATIGDNIGIDLSPLQIKMAA